MSNVVAADFQPTPSNMPSAMKAAELRAATSVLLERMQFLRAAGLSFNGLRDMYQILGYPRVISPAQYRDRYARGGLAGRVVDALPKATWRGDSGGELIEDEDPKVSTTFEKTWEALNKRLKLWAMFQKVDILAAQGRYAVLLLGCPGEFDQELPKGRPEQIIYVQPFSEEDARIMEWDTDEHSPRFGQPTKYQLSRMTANSLSIYGTTAPAFTSTALQKPVHWTRVVHIPSEGALDNDIFGPPRLERVWNLLDDLDKVIGGGAEAFWLRANQGLQLNIDKDITNLSETEKTNLQTQADEYQHQIRRILRTRGVNIETLGSDVANFSNPADAIVTQIAGSSAIPKRILTGSEMGELASSQDRENFRDQVTGRQTGYAGPYVVRPFADRLIAYKYMPAPGKGPEEYQVKWPHEQVLTEQEKSQGAQQWAATNSTQGSPVFTSAEIRSKWYDMEPLTPQQIQDEKELAKPLEPPAPPPGAVQVDENGKPIPPNQQSPLPDAPPQAGGNGKALPFQKKPKPADEEDTKPAKPRAAMDAGTEEALVALLESALRGGDSETLYRVLGVRPPQQPLVLPDVTINTPPAKTTYKEITYGDVQGTIRPIGIRETVQE